MPDFVVSAPVDTISCVNTRSVETHFAVQLALTSNMLWLQTARERLRVRESQTPGNPQHNLVVYRSSAFG